MAAPSSSADEKSTRASELTADVLNLPDDVLRTFALVELALLSSSCRALHDRVAALVFQEIYGCEARCRALMLFMALRVEGWEELRADRLLDGVLMTSGSIRDDFEKRLDSLISHWRQHSFLGVSPAQAQDITEYHAWQFLTFGDPRLGAVHTMLDFDRHPSPPLWRWPPRWSREGILAFLRIFHRNETRQVKRWRRTIQHHPLLRPYWIQRDGASGSTSYRMICTRCPIDGSSCAHPNRIRCVVSNVGAFSLPERFEHLVNVHNWCPTERQIGLLCAASVVIRQWDLHESKQD